MLSKDAFELFNNGVLKKGCRVKMPSLRGFEEFTEIQGAYIKKARAGELEDDWVVVVINGKRYDSAWIDEVEGLSL